VSYNILQCTKNGFKIHRLLKSGGQALMMFYNKYSWLNAMSGLTNVGLEHGDAPVLRKFSIREVTRLLEAFKDVRIQPERFPVETRLHHGLKAQLYNNIFVKTFNRLPKSWVRPFGWHLMVFASKP
jgi:hypothetical protein